MEKPWNFSALGVISDNLEAPVQTEMSNNLYNYASKKETDK